MAQFQEKFIEFKMCLWLPLQLSSKTCVILRRTQGDIITNAHRYSCTVPAIHVRF